MAGRIVEEIFGCIAPLCPARMLVTLSRVLTWTALFWYFDGIMRHVVSISRRFIGEGRARRHGCAAKLLLR